MDKDDNIFQKGTDMDYLIQLQLKRSSSLQSLSARSFSGMRNLARTMMPRSYSNNPSTRQVKERPGELSFEARLTVLAENMNEWFSSLDPDTRKGLIWQESRYERDMEFRESIIYDITECFQAVDFDDDGIINNIQFFVMWRELEEKWSRQGLVNRSPTSDRELNAMFGVFDDYNAAYDGIILEDYIECRALLQEKIVGTRQAIVTQFTSGTENKSMFNELDLN